MSGLAAMLTGNGWFVACVIMTVLLCIIIWDFLVVKSELKKNPPEKSTVPVSNLRFNVLVLLAFVVVIGFIIMTAFKAYDLRLAEQKTAGGAISAGGTRIFSIQTNSSNSPVTKIAQSSNVAVNNNSGNTAISVGSNAGVIGIQSGSNNQQSITYIIGNTNSEPKTTGVLKPHDGGAIVDDSGYGAEFDGHSVMSFSMPTGGSIFPLGQNVPFWISKGRGGLLVNAEVKSMDGKIMAELTDGEWRINPHDYFKLNYDSSGLEIIDDYGIPWLQVDYLTPSTLKIGGIFRGEEDITPKTFPNFPTNVFNGSFFSDGSGTTIIIGNGHTEMRGGIPTETEAQKRAFADEARDIIEPWFDYTPSKGLGVRLSEPKVTTDLSTVQIPPAPVSGMLEGQPFNCDKALLTLMRSTLVLGQGTNAATRVEILLTLNIQTDPSGTFRIPIHSIIPIESVMFYWKNSGGKSKIDELNSNSVTQVWFDDVISNQMNGRLYIESSQRQRTKISGSFKAQFIQWYAP